ncbi:transmembrane protein 130 isoform X2 [Erinaceus europaeus]|uniref:Transmembrane protein 130 isoform X2 n=1 Tax=Erinaceus europaeus TaxID=9365 RepID=A0ABM3VY84_ERIEU|nr:transmembrane protein 130 isoform X2 [Erinaceus europaeus]
MAGWQRLGRLLWLLCLLPAAPGAAAAGTQEKTKPSPTTPAVPLVPATARPCTAVDRTQGPVHGKYKLRLSHDSPVTRGSTATITASLVPHDKSSLVLTPESEYRFQWVHSPLLLTSKVDTRLRSTVRAQASEPGDFPVSVWLTNATCGRCPPLATASFILPVTEFLVGTIDVVQNASLPWPTSYLTKTLLKVSFILHDPSDLLKSASFLYNWDFGNGTQMVTTESEVHYNSSIHGNLTVRLKVLAEWEELQLDGTKTFLQKMGDFVTTVRLQEFLQGIQVLGPSTIQTSEKMVVTLNFLGSPLRSPPMTVCCRVKTACLPLEEGECYPIPVVGISFNVTHIFREPGDYCFSIETVHGANKMRQYHRIQVAPATVQPAVLAFPCATIITMMLAFIMYMSMRTATQQKDMVENPDPPSEGRCCCQVCCGPFLLESPSEYLEVVRESQGLLPPLYKSVKTYTV